MSAPDGNDYAKGNKGGGRPTAYKAEFAKTAEAMCALGATDNEVAEGLGVSVRTVNAWKAKHEEFSAALKIGKELADARVERSLYQRAIGYRQEAVKIFMPAGKDEPIYAPYIEQVQPDTTAAIFWLKNRKAKEWRDKQEIEVTGNIAQLLSERLKRRAEQG